MTKKFFRFLSSNAFAIAPAVVTALVWGGAMWMFLFKLPGIAGH